MNVLFDVDWRALFVPTVPLAEIVLRGTMTYLALFVAMRFVLKRQTGLIGIADLLVIVLIADAAQNAMASEYRSLTEGAVLVATIIFWDYVIDWLSHRFPAIEKRLQPGPLPLIAGGKMLRRNMRQELITEDELMTQLRKHGVDDVGQVKRAFIESDGSISVLTYDKEPGPPGDGGDERRLPD